MGVACHDNELHCSQDAVSVRTSAAAAEQPQPDKTAADDASVVTHVRTGADADDRGEEASVTSTPQHDTAAAEPQPQPDADSESGDGSLAASSSVAADEEEPCAPVQLLTEDAPAVAAAAHAAGAENASAAAVEGPRAAAKAKVHSQLWRATPHC